MADVLCAGAIIVDADGRLLLFEADIAAIVHLMDPVEMFAYKHRHMPRIFDAFAALLRHRIGP